MKEWKKWGFCYFKLKMRAGATFWTLIDNSNRRKVVWRPSKVVMFDSDLVWHGDSNYQTLN
jgi:hypothetical protein